MAAASGPIIGKVQDYAFRVFALTSVCLRIVRILDGCPLFDGKLLTSLGEAMIITCTRCGGLMRIDEGGLPKGRSVKVRCPHCNAIGPIRGAVSPGGLVAGSSDSPSRSRDRPSVAPQAARPAGRELSFPSEVASAFRFPAEQASRSPEKRMFSLGWRMLFWAVGSLLLVGFFALLVNIILPGPYGGGSDAGLPSQDGTSERPVEKHRPSQLEKDDGRSPAKR